MYFTTEEKVAIASVSQMMVIADGRVTNDEKVMTHTIWQKIGITPSDLVSAKQMIGMPALSAISKFSTQKKRLVCAILAAIMGSDYDVDDRELALWRLVSGICDLPMMSMSECADEMQNFLGI